MTESLISPLSSSTTAKLAELADLLLRASYLAREISHERPSLVLPIPELKRPKQIPKDQAWFWSDAWQAGEQEVNEQIQTLNYEVYNTMEDAITALHQAV